MIISRRECVVLAGLIDYLFDTLSDMYWTDERIGKYGEKMTERKLKLVNVFGRKGKILKNVYIPKDNDETSEIDLLYITQKGIFVIESKNYSGWIFGNLKSQFWTACLPNGDKNKFYSPIRQNYTHVKWLTNYMAGYTSAVIPMFSVIVFSDRCELKKVPDDTLEVMICQRDELYWKIRRVWEQLPDILNERDIDITYKILEGLTNVSEAEKQAHIENINNKFNIPSSQTDVALPVNQELIEPSDKLVNQLDEPIQDIEEQVKQTVISNKSPVEQTTKPDEQIAKSEATLICPRCGNSLVLRTAKKGSNAGNQFYGCSNFPKCRYIQNK